MKKITTYQLFGISNCDTVKKVRSYLEEKNITYDFIDFKKRPPSNSEINRWKKFMKTWPVNVKGPTYRKIKDQFEASSDAEKMELLIENSSAIKRPILEENGVVLAIGNDPLFYK